MRVALTLPPGGKPCWSRKKDETILELPLFSRPALFVRMPKHHDIIVPICIARDFDELHRAFAPIADGLDPGTGTFFVDGLEVLIMVKVAITLQAGQSRVDSCREKN